MPTLEIQGGININKSRASLIAYTFSHFCVDFTCFYILFHGLKNSSEDLQIVSIGFLAYNIIAFGLQPMLGYYCDNNPSFPIGMAGCLIVTVGLSLISFSWISLILCAFGNACFHVGGGIDSLMLSNGKMSRCGIFVSSGALGVAFGTYIGQMQYNMLFLPYLFMFIAILSLSVSTKRKKTSCSFEIQIASNLPITIILFIGFISIMLRSYVGSVLPMVWKTSTNIYLPSVCACFGKALGGILGDKFGARAVGSLALLLSIPLVFFGENIAALSMAGIMVFNMTMPITLCTIASVLKHNMGLAFGITTLALLCGSIPAFFISASMLPMRLFLVSFTLLAALCTFLSIKKKGYTS